MLSNSHKIIATNIYENSFNSFGIKLDKNKLLWGSIAPDILPRYRFIRHYQKESLEYVVNKVISLVHLVISSDFSSSKDCLKMAVFSRELGILSHYLTDFVTMPHARRWTFNTAMRAHVEYEKELDIFAKSHDFKKNVIFNNDLSTQENPEDLPKIIKSYIEDIIEEYSISSGFDVDLEYALDINTKISNFIFELAREYKKDYEFTLVLQSI